MIENTIFYPNIKCKYPFLTSLFITRFSNFFSSFLHRYYMLFSHCPFHYTPLLTSTTLDVHRVLLYNEYVSNIKMECHNYDCCFSLTFNNGQLINCFYVISIKPDYNVSVSRNYNNNVLINGYYSAIGYQIFSSEDLHSSLFDFTSFEDELSQIKTLLAFS